MSAEANPMPQNPQGDPREREVMLQALPDPVDSPEAQQGPAERPQRFAWVPWLLAAAAVAFGGLWISQLGYGQQLELRLGTLEAELADARTALDAYGQRMGEVRGQVGELKAGLAVLEGMVAEDSLPVPGGESSLVR